jgi:hypothetical protein
MWLLDAQPLNGNYTVGGASPDFLTLQDAANALKLQGVSNPVYINIRPGIYMENNGVSSVMILDSIIAGISPVNRITFQPDESAGGNVENVILQIDQTTQTTTPLVSLQIDYTTIRNLTFQDVDSAEAGADYLLTITNTFPSNPTNEGIVVEGCRFIGNSHPTGGMVFGTDYGIHGTFAVSDIVIRQNSFQRLMRSIDIGNTGSSGSGRSSAGNVIVEDNEIFKAHFGVTVQGSQKGHGISVQALNAIVRRNYLNNAGGRGSNTGILVLADSGLVERNTILNGGGTIGSGGGQNPYYNAIDIRGPSYRERQAKYMMVVNNMISGCTSLSWVIGIDVITKGAKIVHNTIVNSGGGGGSEIRFNPESDSCTVLNNILIEYGSINGNPASRIIFNQDWGTSGLISDYNVFYHSDPLALIATRGYPNWYSSLSSYQAATGLDSNSIYKDIDFVNDTLYPHLSDCQAQDPELIGIPFPGIVDDIDGDLRSLTAPTMGADEGRMRSNPMFEDVFRYQVSGTPFGIAAGKFDNLMADGLAVTDWTNSQILLFHNLPSSRSFVQSGTLQIGFKPVTLAFYDFDDDSNLDLIVGGDTASIKVFWGDGAGGFPEMTEVSTYGPTTNLVPEPYQLYDSLKLIFVTHQDFIPPNWVAGYIGLLMNLGNRQLCYDRQRAPNGVDPDSISNGPASIVVGDIGGDNMVDIAGIDATGHFTNWEFLNIYMIGVPCGHNGFTREGPYNQMTGVGGNYTYANSIIMGDFDNDSDNDLITTGSTTGCFLLRNEGDFNFIPEPLPANLGRGFAKLDYDNDGDWDFASVNWELQDNGITVFLNDGTGHFTSELNCYQSFATGIPRGIVASDFDLDGKTDLAIVGQATGGYDSLFVLYNTGNVSGIYDDTYQHIPETFSLSQNYPNPFNPTTTIRFEIPEDSRITLKIFNILGEEVSTLVNADLKAGQHEYQFNSSNLASGIYLYRLQAGSFVETKKMILLR